MDIYWIEDKKRKGPEPEVVVISMLQRGELSPETKAWHKGCAEWLPLADLPALSSYFRKKSDEEIRQFEDPSRPEGESGSSEEGGAGNVKVILVPMPGPFTRLMARVMDLHLYTMALTALVFQFSSKPLDVMFSPGNNFLMWIPWILLEAVMLKWWGTTPGKKLFGIRVTSLYGVEPWKGKGLVSVPANLLSGEKKGELSFMQSLFRSIQVMLFGMGFMIPLITIITCLTSLFLLNKTGTTMWDNSSRTVEINQGKRRYLWLTFSLIIIASYLAVYHIYLEEWVPEIQKRVTSMMSGN